MSTRKGRRVVVGHRVIPLKALKWKLRFQQSAADKLSRKIPLAMQVRARRRPTPETVKLLERALSAEERRVQRTDRVSGVRAAMAQEQSAGFRSNVKIRRAIEDYSMKKAFSRLKAMGYLNILDTSSTKPYDVTCEKDGKRCYVEVKGTQTQGTSVILTRGEVQHAEKHAGHCILIVVRDIEMSKGSPVHLDKSKVEVHENWKLLPKDLNPIQYEWKVR